MMMVMNERPTMRMTTSMTMMGTVMTMKLTSMTVTTEMTMMTSPSTGMLTISLKKPEEDVDRMGTDSNNDIESKLYL